MNKDEILHAVTSRNRQNSPPRQSDVLKQYLTKNMMQESRQTKLRGYYYAFSQVWSLGLIDQARYLTCERVKSRKYVK